MATAYRIQARGCYVNHDNHLRRINYEIIMSHTVRNKGNFYFLGKCNKIISKLNHCLLHSVMLFKTEVRHLPMQHHYSELKEGAHSPHKYWTDCGLHHPSLV